MERLTKVQIVINGVIQDEVELNDNSLEVLWETIDNCLMYQEEEKESER